MSDIRFVSLEPRSRVSEQQYTAFLEFMERHGDLAKRQQGSEGRINADRLWVELKDLLNDINGGAVKDLEKWKKVWADWKAKTKRRATQSPREACGTDSGPSRGVTITAVDKRVLAIMGLNAVENSMIEGGRFDDPMPPPTEPVPAESASQNLLGNLECSIPPPSSFQNTPSPPAQSATPPPLPSSTVKIPEPRRMRCATSTPWRRRGRMITTPFERVTNRFVGIERQRLQLEKDFHHREKEREKNIHQREMERLRIESRRLDIEEQQVQSYSRLNRALDDLTVILTKLRPSLRP